MGKTTQEERLVYVQEPRKLLDLYELDFAEACRYLEGFTRTEVRTLLENAEKKKLNFTYKIFDKLVKAGWASKSLLDALSDFYSKSNRPIRGDEFARFRTTVSKAVTYLIDRQGWKLLSEFLLRLEGASSWESLSGTQETSPFMRLIAKAKEYKDKPWHEDEFIERCLHIAHEVWNLDCERGVENDTHDTCLKIQAYYADAAIPSQYNWYLVDKDSSKNNKNIFAKLELAHINVKSDPRHHDQIKAGGKFEIFQHLDRIGAGRYFMSQPTPDARNKCLEYQAKSGSSKSSARIFLERIFSDAYPYTSKANFNWLSSLDLSVELTNDPAPITECLSKMISWEYFDAVLHLLTPLSPDLTTKVMTGLNKDAWERMDEFPEQSAPLFVKMLRAMISIVPLQDIYNFLSEKDIGNIFGYFHEQAEKKLEFDKDIIVMYQRKIQGFIANLQSFVDLLNTDFILAARYMELMTDPEVKALVSNANTSSVQLIETIIDILALGVYKQRGDKIRTPLTKATEHKKDMMLSLGLIKLGVNGYGYYSKPIYFEGSWQHLSIGDRANHQSNGVAYVVGNAVNEMVHQAEREKVMVPLADNMLSRLIPCLEGVYVQWPSDMEKLRDMFFGLMQRDQPDLTKRIILASSPDLLPQAVRLFIGTKAKANKHFQGVFIPWLVKSIDYVVPRIANALQATSTSFSAYLNHIEDLQLNKIFVEILTADVDSVTSLLRRVNTSDEKLSLITHVNDELLKVLKAHEDESYGVALYQIDTKYFEKHYNEFHVEMSKRLLRNRYLARAVLGAEAPPSVVDVIPKLYPNLSSADSSSASTHVMAHDKQVTGDAQAEILRRLDEMQKSLRLLTAPAADPEQWKREREVMTLMIVNLIDNSLDKSVRIASLELALKDKRTQNNLLIFKGLPRQNHQDKAPQSGRGRSNSLT